MTLIIATTNSEGVILTADSRQTYVNRASAPRIASDNATKITQMAETMAIAMAGPAFFNDGGRLRSIQSYIEEFRDSHWLPKNGTGPQTCLATAQDLDTFCQEWLERTGKEGINQFVAAQPGATGPTIKPRNGTKIPYEYIDGNGTTVTYEWQLPIPTLIVVGRDPDGVCHSVSVVPFSGIGLKQSSLAPMIMWIGQGEVLTKLLAGTDPFVISTATMTIQDAVDFSILLTRTTENLHKFSDGTAASQGGIPGVGGPIDVIYIPTNGDLRWLGRKQLHGEGPDSPH